MKSVSIQDAREMLIGKVVNYIDIYDSLIILYFEDDDSFEIRVSDGPMEIYLHEGNVYRVFL